MTAREKCQKCERENDFAPVKKVAKSAQNGFHAHFWFSREKKNTADKYGGQDFYRGFLRKKNLVVKRSESEVKVREVSEWVKNFFVSDFPKNWLSCSSR